jgi:hypothetical protein
LYGYDKAQDFDSYFTASEPVIHKPVEQLITSKTEWVDLHNWASVAWYITCLFTRAPEFELEVNEMAAKEDVDPHIMMVGYPLNTQRVGSAIARARWQVALSPRREFILGDRGITGIYNPDWKSYGYLIPVRRDAAIILGTGPYRKPARWSDGQWRLQVEHRTLDAHYVDELNRTTWHAGISEVYSSNEDILETVRNSADQVSKESLRVAKEIDVAGMLGLSAQQRRDDEMLIFKAQTLGPPPDDFIKSGLELFV